MRHVLEELFGEGASVRARILPGVRIECASIDSGWTVVFRSASWSSTLDDFFYRHAFDDRRSECAGPTGGSGTPAWNAEPGSGLTETPVQRN